jgi:hypothetical protein
MKTPIYIITLIAIGIIAFFGGQYAAKKPAAQKTTIMPGTSDAPEPPVTPNAPEANSTAQKTQIYISKILNYQIEVPTGLSVETTLEEKQSETIVFDSEEQERKNNDPAGFRGSWIQIARRDDQNLTIEQWVAQHPGSPRSDDEISNAPGGSQISKPINIDINSTQALQQVVDSTNVDGIEGAYEVVTYLQVNGRIFTITLTTNNKTAYSKHVPEYNQLVASFRTTNESE